MIVKANGYEYGTKNIIKIQYGSEFIISDDNQQIVVPLVNGKLASDCYIKNYSMVQLDYDVGKTHHKHLLDIDSHYCFWLDFTSNGSILMIGDYELINARNIILTSIFKYSY